MRRFLPLVLLPLSLAAAAQPQSSEPQRAALAKALTLHASFDRGLDADFARGDRTLYSYATNEQRAQGGVKGLPDNLIQIAKGAGHVGDALLVTKKNPVKPFYKDGGNIGYNATDWSCTVSVWLRLTPDIDLEPGYCDPVQFVGNDTNKGYIFLEFDRDSNPRYFRYAIRPLLELWDPQKVGWAALPFDKRPMVQVDRAPFSRAKWTHVVFTVEHVNSKTTKPSGRLYIDGKLQGAIENWDLTFGWDPNAALLVLAQNYTGHIDELAVFDRVLTQDEVKVVCALPNGVADLRR
jgi:hypothetical protein